MKYFQIKSLLFILCVWQTAFCSELHVCTIATNETPGLINLKNSCAYQGIDLTVLGMGKKWPGNIAKILWAREHIEKLDNNDIFLLVDGYDILIVGSADEIKEKFLSFNAPFVMGAEGNCWPSWHEITQRYPTSKTRFRYINAGCYIGYVWAVKEILDNLPTDSNSLAHCDQWRFHKYFIANNDKITLDSECQLVLNLSRIPPDHIWINQKEKRIFHTPTKTKPAIIHGCGYKKKYILALGDYFFS